MKVFIVDEDSRDGVSAQLKEANEAIRYLECVTDWPIIIYPVPCVRFIFKPMISFYICLCTIRKVMEDVDGGKVAERTADINLESTDRTLPEPTGPPFGIVVNGHSLVRKFLMYN